MAPATAALTAAAVAVTVKPEKTRLYLDTSVISTYFDQRTPNRMLLTQAFWTNVQTDDYELFVSEVTLLEMARTPSADRLDEMRQLVSNLPSLNLSDKAWLLADDILASGVVPPNKMEDALHLALAFDNGLHSIVSWNFKHMVNIKIQRELPVIAVKHGYHRPLLLVTPQHFGLAL